MRFFLALTRRRTSGLQGHKIVKQEGTFLLNKAEGCPGKGMSSRARKSRPEFYQGQVLAVQLWARRSVSCEPHFPIYKLGTANVKGNNATSLWTVVKIAWDNDIKKCPWTKRTREIYLAIAAQFCSFSPQRKRTQRRKRTRQGQQPDDRPEFCSQVRKRPHLPRTSTDSSSLSGSLQLTCQSLARGATWLCGPAIHM